MHRIPIAVRRFIVWRSVALATLTALAVAVMLGAAGPAGATIVIYQLPVDGVVKDPFRPPTNPYGPGNRGVEFATAAGAVVMAPADGTVTFAGQVGGDLFVVVGHDDGVRTTMGYLASILVVKGEVVRRGQPVGIAASAMHWGARRGETYIDPMSLLRVGPPRVHLVADDGGATRPAPGPFDKVGATVGGFVFSSPPIASVPSANVAALGPGSIIPMSLGLGGGLPRLFPSQDTLGDRIARSNAPTAPATTTPAPPRPCTAKTERVAAVSDRRMLILVPGLDSDLAGGMAHAVRTRDLGYDPADVDVFSYRGGFQPYQGKETTVDLREAARLLRAFIAEKMRLHPGVPIDIVAHSQGGLVAREALTATAPPPEVTHLVTLSSPHQGAPLASLIRDLRASNGGRLVVGTHDHFTPEGAQWSGESILQIAEGSDFLKALNARPIPSGLAVTSIAARGDLVVPAPSARWVGAVNVVIDVPGLLQDHSSMVGSDAATRELALALTDRPPTCETAMDRLADAVVGRLIRTEERASRVLTGPAALRHEFDDVTERVAQTLKDGLRRVVGA